MGGGFPIEDARRGGGQWRKPPVQCTTTERFQLEWLGSREWIAKRSGAMEGTRRERRWRGLCTDDGQGQLPATMSRICEWAEWEPSKGRPYG